MKRGSTALLWQLLRRDLKERYVGTAFGVAWLIVPPFVMLLVYSVVFGEILQLRLAQETDTVQFALSLFTGLTAFNALAEVLTRAPNLLHERRDLLLNSALPAALLPLLPVGISVLLELISIGFIFITTLALHQFHWQTLLYYPVFLLLRMLLAIAFAYLLAALGAFLRDIRQLMPAVLSLLLMTAPVVYPLSAVPDTWQIYYQWNPLTALVEGYRAALLEGQLRTDLCLGLMALAALLVPPSVAVFKQLMPRARYVL